jgi:hypothetical protein
MFKYVRNLEFEEIPDYDFIKNLILKIMEDNNICVDYVYDWNVNLNTNNHVDDKNSS